MAGGRRERVEELIVREVSDILRREVKDPRIGFVTVTEAEVSPDLRQARVFVSVMGSDEEREAALKGLNSAARFIRGQFGKRVAMRVTPELTFRFDTSIDRGARIFELLEQVRREGAEGTPGRDLTAEGRPATGPVHPPIEDGHDEGSASESGGSDPAGE
jgi:ribosome-binding factor A